MDYAAISDPLVKFAFWTGVVSLLLTGLLGFQVILMRVSMAVDKRRAKVFEHTWQPLMIEVMAGETPPIPRLLRHQRMRFLMLWVHYHESLRGKVKNTINELFLQVHVQSYVNDLLAKGDLDEKLVAVTVQGHLRDRAHWSELTTLLASESPVLSITAARALIMIDPIQAGAPVIAAIIARRDWPNSRLANLLRESSPEFIQAFIHQLDLAAIEKSPVLPRLIRLFETLQHNFMPDSLKNIIATSNDPQLVPMCLRLIKDPNDLELVRGRLQDPNWQVQVQAATVIGRIGSQQDVRPLTELLSSKEWWVRYRAAKAILALPFMQDDDFKTLLAELTDPYARDIFLQVLAERTSA